jgi:phage-related protein
MSNLGKAYVQVIPSAKGIKGQLSNIFGSEGNSAGTSFGTSLIGKVKGLIAAAGIGKALGDSLFAGANLQQSLGGIETLFKDSADIVIKNADQAYRTAGMSANRYMETVTGFSASLLQGLSGDTEKAAAVADMALTDMADNANKMGTSMELIQNAYQGFAKQNYTMLDNLKLGYGGTKTEMERLLADAQKLTGIKYDISNLSDVYEAIHVIQEEMGITGTTALESAATFTGSLASMKAAFSDLLANLATGRDIRGSLDALSETVFIFAQDNLFPMVGNIFAELPTVLESALSMAIRGLNLVANNADAIVQMGIDLVTGIGTAIISAAPYLLEAALRIVSALGNALLSADWAAIGSTTISALRDNLDLAAGEILGTDGNIVQSVLTAITTHLPNLLSGGSSMVVSVVNGLLQQLPFLLQTGGQLAEQLISTLISFAPEILSAGVTLVLNLANGLIQNLPAVITSAISILGQLIATILSHLPQLLESGISLIGQLAAGLIQAIPQVLAAIPQIINSIVSTFKGWNWREIGSNIVSGIANGISSGASAIISAAQSAARAALNAAKRFLGIASPSKVMRDQVGKFIPEGMAIGIEANTKPLTDAMHDLSDLTTSTAQADIARGAKTTGIPVSTTGNVYGNSTFTINVYASDNMDVDELAETVMQKIQFAVSQREVCFA